MWKNHCKLIVILNLVYIMISVSSQYLEGKSQRELFYNKVCEKLAVDPYFEADMVVGKSWRIYYTWHMDLEMKCMDFRFKYASPMVIQRVFNDMSEYMEMQPTWSAALLLMTMGKADHEVLLFADNGPAGRMLAVPNVVREGHVLIPNKQAVPLLKFQMKLLHGGKYLVVMDCLIGVASLATRVDDPPYRSELETIAAKLDLGDGGAHACTQDKNKNENVVYSDKTGLH